MSDTVSVRSEVNSNHQEIESEKSGISERADQFFRRR